MYKDFKELFRDITSEYVTVYDCNKNEVIYNRDGDVECYPASITKVLNCLLAVNYLKEDDILIVGDELDVCYSSPDPSVAGVKKGQKWTFKDALYGLLLPSGNDVAYTIGFNIINKIGKYNDLSVKEKCLEYVKLMNEYAKKLGCKCTEFYTPDGNDHVNKKVVRHVTCTNDLAIILNEARKNELLNKVMSTPSITFNHVDDLGEETYKFTNTNKLIRKETEFYNEYVIGGKTGTTNLAGYCLATYAKKGDQMYIVALTYAGSGNDRYRDSNKIYDFLFNKEN